MIDPSKLSPQAIAEITDLMRTLTPDQMMKMQSLMHNSMAGFNVAQEMAAFEQSLPAGFREKMARVMYMMNGIEVPAPTPAVTATTEAPKNESDARLIILQSVANGLMAPEEALKVLFPN
jgi:hypothetical protein